MLIRQAAHIIVYGPRDPEKPDTPPLPLPPDFTDDPDDIVGDDDEDEEDDDEEE